MSDEKDMGVRVTMRKASASDDSVDAGDEWDDGFAGEAPRTAIDPNALKELRESAGAEEASTAAAFADAADEFASAPATVMEDIEELSTGGLVEMVQAGEVGAGPNADFDDDSVTVMDPRAMGDLPSAESSIGKEACPGCGVMVAPGYPKCPRCKRSLVTAGARDAAKAGGTTMAGRTIPWAIVFVAAVLTGIIVYLAERDPVTDSSKKDISEARPAAKAGVDGESPDEPPVDDDVASDPEDATDDEVAVDSTDAG